MRIAGVDEAGRGCLAGPVYAAAVIFHSSDFPDGLDDSKKLTALRREQLELAIQDCATVSVASASCCEIDRFNILNAAMLAMKRAVERLNVKPDHLLIDGNRLPQELPCPARAVVGGDALSVSIAAASIIAKVHRDRHMRELDRLHPGYGWARNSGYGTRQHLDALRRHGPTAQHRRSFRPVRDALDEFSPVDTIGDASCTH